MSEDSEGDLPSTSPGDLLSALSSEYVILIDRVIRCNEEGIISSQRVGEGTWSPRTSIVKGRES